MIKEAEKKRSNNPAQPKLPMLRLNIQIADDLQHSFNTTRLGHQFSDDVNIKLLALKICSNFIFLLTIFINRSQIQALQFTLKRFKKEQLTAVIRAMI